MKSEIRNKLEEIYAAVNALEDVGTLISKHEDRIPGGACIICLINKLENEVDELWQLINSGGRKVLENITGDK